MGELILFRLSHRKERDKRITTHCFLVARALGCNSIYYSGERDEKIEESLLDVEERFGKVIKEIKYIEDPKKFLIEMKKRGKKIAHLTMYGISPSEKIEEMKNEDLVIVIGSEKVPSWMYEIADYNISITNQPHSEVAALAIFLFLLKEGKQVSEKWEERFKGKLKILPCEKGKKVCHSKIEEI